jgi:hypothetical protein
MSDELRKREDWPTKLGLLTPTSQDNSPDRWASSRHDHYLRIPAGWNRRGASMDVAAGRILILALGADDDWFARSSGPIWADLALSPARGANTRSHEATSKSRPSEAPAPENSKAQGHHKVIVLTGRRGIECRAARPYAALHCR